MGKALSSVLKLELFADFFFGSRHCMFAYIRWCEEKSGNISEDLSFFVFFYFIITVQTSRTK